MSWIVLPWLGFTLVGAHLVLLVLGDALRESVSWPRPGSARAARSRLGRGMSLLGVDVPPVSHVTIWGSGPLGLNKTAVDLHLRDAGDDRSFFWLGTRRRTSWCRRGIMQNTAESGVGFVRNQIIMQTMGADGLGYLPYLTTLFFFIFFSNITEIIPVVQFPANARFGMPLVLALLTWVIFNVVGIMQAGPAPLLQELGVSRPACPKAILMYSSSPRSSSSRRSSSGRSRWRSDSSPTCSPATSSW